MGFDLVVRQSQELAGDELLVTCVLLFELQLG